MVEGLLRRHPDLIFLDISLERSDAVDAIRALGQSGYGGAVQLMSGRAADLLEQVNTVGSNRGLSNAADFGRSHFGQKKSEMSFTAIITPSTRSA
jgi:CheY-like chemotaxis protein